jgi:hypothetical protein
VLIVFIMYEMCKGEDSFWGPYFECASWADLPYCWSDDDLTELEDELLKFEIIEYRKEVQGEWEATLEVISQYP